MNSNVRTNLLSFELLGGDAVNSSGQVVFFMDEDVPEKCRVGMMHHQIVWKKGSEEGGR